MSLSKSPVRRRTFLKRASLSLAAGAVAPYFVPRHVLGGPGQTAPSDTVLLGGIGFGSMGGYDIRSAAKCGAKIVALCDVDFGYAGKNADQFPDAHRYTDYRELLDQERDVDGVIIGTPDHTHAIISMAALQLGKHVYCEKPLAHTLYECRKLTEAARNSNVAFQLANQGHTYPTLKEFCDVIWSGQIGTVKEIHIQQQGYNFSQVDRLKRQQEQHEVPKTLDYDLWLGPAAFRPYIPSYHRGSWRGWSNFGTGMIGDWTCHLIDPVFTALDLGAPTSVVAECEGYDPIAHAETCPKSSKITYEFPERENFEGSTLPPVTLTWYDGDLYEPPRPDGLKPDEPSIPVSGRNRKPVGGMVVGDQGTIVYGTHGAAQWRLIPEASMDQYMEGKTRVDDPRGPGMPENILHLQDWLAAVKGYRRNASNLDYGGPLTEIAMLGTIAQRMPGTKLEWDAKHMSFPNQPSASQYLHYRYRDGWSL